MPSYKLAPGQEDAIEAMTKVGPFQNKSEVVRAALESFFGGQSEPRRILLAIQLVKDGLATVGKAAEVAGKDYAEMEEILGKEGLLGDRMTAADLAKASKGPLPVAPPARAATAHKVVSHSKHVVSAKKGRAQAA